MQNNAHKKCKVSHLLFLKSINKRGGGAKSNKRRASLLIERQKQKQITYYFVTETVTKRLKIRH